MDLGLGIHCEPEVNDNLKIQQSDPFHSLFPSKNPVLMEKKGTEAVLDGDKGNPILLFSGFFSYSSFKLVFPPFTSLDYFTDEKLEAQRGSGNCLRSQRL